MKIKRNGIPLYVNYQGKQVVSGILGHDKVFRKSVETKQKLIVMDAYGIDEPNFEELKALGCEMIELIERDTGKKYLIDFATFEKMAVPRKIGKFNVRYYLPLRYWRKVEAVV
ncbi:MAG: hypothetical protein PWP45_640 [Tepidanaerobacteraceae bacterium]|nr:hypothetical protein [Tepidanaerobacteraceae bacterium]